jgi:hypothetical protein
MKKLSGFTDGFQNGYIRLNSVNSGMKRRVFLIQCQVRLHETVDLVGYIRESSFKPFVSNQILTHIGVNLDQFSDDFVLHVHIERIRNYCRAK